MSVALIGNIAVKDFGSLLPQKIGRFKFISPSYQPYWDNIKNDFWIIEAEYIMLGIESDLKCDLDSVNLLGTLVAALRLVKPNKSVLCYLIEDPNNKSSKWIQLPTTTLPYILDKRIPDKRIELRDFEILRSIWPKVEQLYTTKYYSRIKNAIDFIEHSRWSLTFQDSLISLVAGLESLFTTDNLELSYKISIRASWFVYPSTQNFNKRQILFKKLKEMYSYRSTILHGNDVTKYIKREEEYLATAQYVLRASILKILRNDKLFGIFNSKNSELLENYFLKITSGEKV